MVPSGRFSARKAGGSVKQWDTDKLGCVLETSWHSYRQTVVGSWQMLLDCPPARTSPASLLLSLFLSLSPFSVFHSPPHYHLLLLSRRLDEYVGLEKSRERLVESDSNQVRTAQPWKRKRFVHAPRRLPEKSCSKHARETLLDDLCACIVGIDLHFLIFRDF